MTKVPRQTKGNKSGKQVFKATRPGKVVSVDQLISTQPGFVTQLKSKLTFQCYKAATIFVHHFSGLQYIHMMTSMSSNETIKAKQAFEQLSANHFVTIEHYPENGCFIGNIFISNCSQRQHQLTYYEGHPADYIGVNIKKSRDGTYKFTQRALIDSIIDDVEIGNSYTKPVPAKVSLQLHAFRYSQKFKGNFNYCSAVGKLNYLGQTTRPDILYAVHQAAKYSADPRVEHGEALVYIIKYLKATRHIGLQFKPASSKGFQCYCDADFAGNRNKEFAPTDPSTAKSRSGWSVFYASCPIIWASKLQSQVALSTTEAKYIAISMALRDVIPLMELIQEMRERKFDIVNTQPYVYCKVFEGNSGALELARLPRLRPCTKQINVCYHHFREHV
ncbi:hypothetical protein ACHAW6_008690 [Cyclotella cf. meneghiniana]